MLYVPVNKFLVMLGHASVFLVWTSTKQWGNQSIYNQSITLQTSPEKQLGSEGSNCFSRGGGGGGGGQ